MGGREFLRRCVRCAVAAVGLSGLTVAMPGEPWQTDWSQADVGPVTVAELASALPGSLRWAEGFADGSTPGRVVLRRDYGSSPALEVSFPPGAVGPKAGGAQFMADLSPADDYTLEYRVWFDPQFDWVKGGKLPGLAGGRAPSGGRFDPHGFTARYMWRPEGRLVLYLYWAGQRSAGNPRGGQYAEDLSTGVVLRRGQTYTLKQRVRLNAPGASDGTVQVWVDGRLVLDRGDLVFRTAESAAWAIDAFFFSTFHGGNDPSWAPSRSSQIRFSDFRIWHTENDQRLQTSP